MDVLTCALSYAQRGWPVLPLHAYIDACCTCGKEKCDSPAKHPITANGVKDASTDASVIRRWMEETDGKANLGIAANTRLVVLDADVKSGGLASLEAWEALFDKLPLTPTVLTGGGGRHYYLGLPEGIALGNRTGVVPGIDIRGTGGYVVAPPSMHVSGERYRWETSEDLPLAPIPPWLLEILVSPAAQGDASPGVKGMTLRVQPPAADLTDALGVNEGQRHARLCQLVGIHLARGESADAVETLALVWAAHCQPPLGDAEVRKTVHSLARKHASTVILATVADDIDAIPLPQEPPWPVLDETALHGMAGETVRLIAPHTEADPVAILASVLVCAGNCMGRKVWFPVEGDRHHVNLFACLVGDTSRGRKGTSLARTLTLWAADDPWKKHCIVSGLSSGEGLKWAVRDKVEVIEPIKERGKVVGYQSVIKDHGVDDKRLLVVEPEFVQTLKVAQREGNTVSAVLRQAYDTGTLRTLTRNDPTVATGADISILAHITRRELQKELSDTDCSNIFANRFLWFAVRRSKLLPDGGIDVDMTPLQNRLAEILARPGGTMSRSPAARQLWHDLYPHLTADRTGLWGMVTSRGEAQTLRLSMVYAALDGTTVIDVPHLMAAVAVWHYAEASARLIFAEEEAMDPLQRSLLEKITASPGVNRRALHKALGGHIQAEAMVKALGKLASLGKVRSEMIGTGGRPAECWFPYECERTNKAPAPAEVQPVSSLAGQATLEAKASPVAAGERRDSSFARTTDVMSLADLFTAITSIGGRLVRHGDRVVVVDGSGVTPQIEAACREHQADLRLLVVNRNEEVSHLRNQKGARRLVAR